MDFEWNRETRMIRDAVQNWINRECPEESVREWDEAGGAPETVWKKFLKLGFTALSVPEAYEGEGPDYLGSILVAETLASRYPALARRYDAVTFFGGAVIAELGDEKQKAAWLPKFAQGKQTAAVFLSAADSADGPAPPLPSAASGPDGPTLSGGGRCIGPAKSANCIVVPVLTEESEDADIQIYCLEAKNCDFQINAEAALGYQGDTGASVFFNDTRLRPENLMTGAGKTSLQHYWGLIHLALGAEALGIARGSLDYAVKYANQRMQFNRPIARFPAIRDMLLQMDCDIEAAALLLYRAAAMADAGKPWAGDAARAYYASCRTARRAAMDGLQILGGYGYTMEFAAQRYVRDAVTLFNTGAESEGLKSVLSRQIGI